MNQFDDKLARLEHFRQVDEASLAAGMNIYPDDLCGKLLAYVGEVGDEQAVLILGFHAAIMAAARRFDFKTGGFPKPEHIALITKYRKEIASGEAEKSWLPELRSRYGLKKTFNERSNSSPRDGQPAQTVPVPEGASTG